MGSTIDDFDGADFFDIRDVIARLEELEGQEDEDAKAEWNELDDFLSDVRGCGGDEQWRGDWYPVLFIRDSHFEDYAREFAEEVGAIPSDAQWPCTCIDWEQAADELQIDYSSTNFRGTTYWYR